MSAELKPCPFCNGPAVFVKHSAGHPGTMGYDQWHAVKCNACDATVGAYDRRFRNKDDAAKVWNRRTPIAPGAAEGNHPEFPESSDLLAELDRLHAEVEGVQEVVETYKKLHEGKETLHWLWDVIEQIAAGVPEDEAFRSFGYYEPGAVPAVGHDCTWSLDEDDSGTWATSCGNLFSFTDGGPKENDFKHCCYCGGKLASASTAGRGEG